MNAVIDKRQPRSTVLQMAFGKMLEKKENFNFNCRNDG